MSRLIGSLLLGGLLAFGAPGLDAQVTLEDQADEIQRLEDALDEKIVEWQAASRRAQIADSVRMARAGLEVTVDSTRVGPFTVLTRSERTETYIADAERAWEMYADLLAGLPEAAAEDLGNTTVAIVQGGRIVGGSSTVWLEPYYPPPIRVYRIAQVFDQQISQHLPVGFKQWVPSTGLRTEAVSRNPWIYRSLLTGQSKVMQGCYDGSLDDCWRSVGLMDADRWWEAWYEPHQLRMRIEKRFGRDHYQNFTGWSECVDEGLYEGCEEFVGSSSRGPNSVIPLSAGARESLVAYALRRGGEGALSRLMEERGGPGGIPALLAYAAGTTETELIRGWREQIMAARPDVTEGAAGTAAATLGWIVLLGVFATRSTRWRI